MSGEQKVDHAAEAVRMLGLAIKGPKFSEQLEVEQRQYLAERFIATAQVHATLALVDQQRIANVLAVKALHVGAESGDDLEVTDTRGMIRWVEEQLGLEEEWDRRLGDELQARKDAGL